MSFIRMVWLCLFGPRLRRYYSTEGTEGQPYQPNKLEHYSDRVISLGKLFGSFLFNVSPFVVVYYAVKEVCGIPSFIGLLSTIKQYTLIPVLFGGLVVCRGIGRLFNKDYRQFLICLIKAQSEHGRFSRQKAITSGIHNYDFEMFHAPISFKYSDSTISPQVVSQQRRLSWKEWVTRLPTYSFSYMAAHMIGRRLMYPGSLQLIQIALNPMLQQGRAKYIKQHNGTRACLLAADGNRIDTMFLDRRGVAGSHGNILVICSEGNASFYECGMMEVPIDGNYSVLGWNHPGFADSTGLPMPTQECCAIDVVLQYAVCELSFNYEDIVLYGWSIGGYATSWAAMSYPKISAVILDATFDHILPLAQLRLPQAFAGIVETVVTDCLDLNVAEYLLNYPGPVHLIRRGNDEMITTKPLDRTTNRINFLLIRLLQCRYPYLVNAETLPVLQQWINTNAAIVETSVELNKSRCNGILTNYMDTYGPTYPWYIGQEMSTDERLPLLLYLAGQYFATHDLAHNDKLPPECFRVPMKWNLNFSGNKNKFL